MCVPKTHEEKSTGNCCTGVEQKGLLCKGARRMLCRPNQNVLNKPTCSVPSRFECTLMKYDLFLIYILIYILEKVYFKLSVLTNGLLSSHNKSTLHFFAHLTLCTGRLNPTLLLVRTIDCNCGSRLNVFPTEYNILA